jgi:ribosomal protein S18 acetylase RimI-like enzyme
MLRSPSTVRIRPARVTDAADLARIFRDSWRLAYSGMIPADHLDRLIRKRDVEWWKQSLQSSEPALILEVAGTIAGYATYGVARTRGRFQGEIYELYLDPIYQGLGFGEHLFEACRHRLDERRLKGLVVWALVDNAAASAFYWRRGGRPLASAMETFGTQKLEKVAFTWP